MKTYAIELQSDTLTPEQVTKILRCLGHDASRSEAMTRGSGLRCDFSAPGKPTVTLFHGPVTTPESWVFHNGVHSTEVSDPVAWVDERWSATVTHADDGGIIHGTMGMVGRKDD